MRFKAKKTFKKIGMSFTFLYAIENSPFSDIFLSVLFNAAVSCYGYTQTYCYYYCTPQNCTNQAVLSAVSRLRISNEELHIFSFSPNIVSVTKKGSLRWDYSMDGGNKKCIKDFNRKISVKERKLDVFWRVVPRWI